MDEYRFDEYMFCGPQPTTLSVVAVLLGILAVVGAVILAAHAMRNEKPADKEGTLSPVSSGRRVAYSCTAILVGAGLTMIVIGLGASFNAFGTPLFSLLIATSVSSALYLVRRVNAADYDCNFVTIDRPYIANWVLTLGTLAGAISTFLIP